MNKAQIWISRQITLFETAFIDVRQLDDTGNFQECNTFKLENNEYKEWKEDPHLIDCLKKVSIFKFNN